MPKYRHAYAADEGEMLGGEAAIQEIQAVLDRVAESDRPRVLELLGEFLNINNQSTNAEDNDIPGRQEIARQSARRGPGGGAVPAQDRAMRARRSAQMAQDSAGFAARWPEIVRGVRVWD